MNKANSKGPAQHVFLTNETSARKALYYMTCKAKKGGQK